MTGAVSLACHACSACLAARQLCTFSLDRAGHAEAGGTGVKPHIMFTGTEFPPRGAPADAGAHEKQDRRVFAEAVARRRHGHQLRAHPPGHCCSLRIVWEYFRVLDYGVQGHQPCSLPNGPQWCSFLSLICHTTDLPFAYMSITCLPSHWSMEMFTHTENGTVLLRPPHTRQSAASCTPHDLQCHGLNAAGAPVSQPCCTTDPCTCHSPTWNRLSQLPLHGLCTARSSRECKDKNVCVASLAYHHTGRSSKAVVGWGRVAGKGRAWHLEQRYGERDGGCHAELCRYDLPAVRRVILCQRITWRRNGLRPTLNHPQTKPHGCTAVLDTRQ